MKVKYIVLLILGGALASCNSGENEESKKGNEKAEVTFKSRENEKKVDVFIDGNHITSYIYPESIKKPVLYPVKTLGGIRLTRGFPFEAVEGERVDHPHHVGLWFTYGDVEGLDFWNNSDSIKAENRHKYGTIIHKSVEKTEGGPEGTLVVNMDWVNPDGEVLLKERATYVFIPGEKEYSIHRITELTAVNDDISMNDNKEGMIGIRVTRELEHPSDKPEVFTDANGLSTQVAVINNDGVKGEYINSEGIRGLDTWGKRANWVNLTSKIGESDISLVIVDHSSNPGHPTYWHSRGYGLFAANPLGQEVFSNGKEKMNFTIQKEQTATFKHKIIVAEKVLNKEDIDKRFTEFSTKN